MYVCALRRYKKYGNISIKQQFYRLSIELNNRKLAKGLYTRKEHIRSRLNS